MAHFERPTEARERAGTNYLGGSKEDKKIWGVKIPINGSTARVRLWGGNGLSVTSNNPSVLANPIPESRQGNFRELSLIGQKLGTTMIETSW